MIPKVSIIMPVYNCRLYIEESVNSIINQTFTDFEFIIIDDCSTDGTFEYLQSLSDPRINLFRKNQNSGHTNSLKIGLDLAKGVYIARMDGDDISYPDRFAKQIDFMEAHPEVGVLGTGVQIMDTLGNISFTVNFPTQHAVLRWSLCFYDPIVHPTVIMRHEIVKRVGGYNIDMIHAEDYDLWRRMSELTQLSNLHDVLLYLRKHDSNVSTLNPIEERRLATHVSYMMISQILKEDINPSTIQLLWDPLKQTAHDASNVAKLVYRLFQANVAIGDLSAIEKNIIRKDAAIRIYYLSRPWLKTLSIWGDLARAFYLNPILLLWLAKKRAIRIFRLLLRLLVW